MRDTRKMQKLRISKEKYIFLIQKSKWRYAKKIRIVFFTIEIRKKEILISKAQLFKRIIFQSSRINQNYLDGVETLEEDANQRYFENIMKLISHAS